MKSPLRTFAILVVGSAALVGGTQPRRALAVDGAIQNPANGHWYKLVTSTVAMTWSSCKSNSEALGGYLATITSAEENQWVTTNMVPSGHAWLGGSDAASEGNWRWVSGEPWSYSSWGGVEPNDAGTGEHSLLTNYEGAGMWADAYDAPGPGLPIYQYVVEWSGPPGPPTPAGPPDAPSSLVGSVAVGSPIRLLWADNSDDEEEFEVERRTDTTLFGRVAELGPNSTIFEDTATAPDTSYTYRVRAKNSAGNSGYSNEDTVVSSAIAPAPKAPALFTVVQATSDSVELQWADISLDEVAFELHRRTPNGTFAVVASIPSNSWTFTDAGLPPDSPFVYGVRSVNAFRASPLIEVAAATLPTLSVTTVRGDFKDSTKSLKDSLKVWVQFDFLPETPDGVFDPVVEGLSLRAGDGATPLVMGLPANLDGWKVARGRATWKSPKGSTPKYKFEVDLEARLVKVTATGLELATPPINPVRISLGIGNDAGTDTRAWEATKPGAFRLR